ncbi:Flp pilus assembly complex ATPase component TadA [Staphylococcus arlettae]|uniref:competence type IV pilus ATPase ComGA n=1 Tax=Staphylococcus arlettae TaxID=29378 RepID=UPI001E2F19EB|nr:competence type IV pilus ATPase ComGA [Staphylococcus arlettae]MCD9053863.1 Flp pilus assembly complex ATPase component TadA [Staphylococcus arlettae]
MKLLFEDIMTKAIKQKTSDIHFIPVENEVVIKLRVNESLIDFQKMTKHTYAKLLTYMKYQACLDVSTHHIAQSGRYIYNYKQLYYLRISTLPLSLGIESCVIRIIPQYFYQSTEEMQLDYLYHLMTKKQGLVLFTGPTGSGKSTSMYQMSLYAKEQLNLNVITIEDPVERIIDGITQISVNTKAGIDYHNSFKAILRCDPDVILIGEIRNAEIAKQVIHASLSGHLVLTTLHANSCEGALLRLLEMGLTNQELVQTIINITNQRLITSNDKHRYLVAESLSHEDIHYFFNNNYRLPEDFQTLPNILQRLSQKGFICEKVVQKYI